MSTVYHILSTHPEQGKDLCDKVIFAVFIFAGLRKKEVANLIWERVKIDHCAKRISIIFQDGESKTGEDEVIISACENNPAVCAYSLIIKYYGECVKTAVSQISDSQLRGRVFRKWIVKRSGGYFSESSPIGENTVGKIFKDLLIEYKEKLPEDVQWEITHGRVCDQRIRKNKAGAVIVVRHGIDRYTSHSGRRTMATFMAEMGFCAAEIQSMLRHKNQSTSQEYIDSSDRVRKSTSKKLSNAISIIDRNNVESEADVTKDNDVVIDDELKAVGGQENKKNWNLVFNNCNVTFH
ncbi:hypothetical protein AKO1_006776 [Acrasis kona]|uniref:Tyr recombinase domain-containing protein n=1 Tax=Acrasis kona TaxID=1008807 RepID=A0AAW2Z6T1_9EUKA